jgi:hypothetical protein
MKKLGSIRTASTLLAFVALLIILAQPASTQAQKRRPNPPPPPTIPPTTESQPPQVPNMRTMDQATLEMAVLMSKRWTVADQQKEQRRAAAQITLDLERLSQIEAESIAQTSSQSIDYKNLARATAEIKERIIKIKYNLPFMLKDKGEKVRRESDTSQLGAMLPELSKMIKSFVSNPSLRVNSPNDVELRAAAGHDMEGIIKLSEIINKIAKSLSKPLVANK